MQALTTCHHAGLVQSFASMRRHAQHSLLQILHSDPARTHSAPVHLLAEAAHGVAELAHVQRAAQVRICRAGDTIAVHSLKVNRSAGIGQRESLKHPTWGTVCEVWSQGHAHTTTLDCFEASTRKLQEDRIIQVAQASRLCAVLTQCIEQRRQPLAPRDLRVFCTVCRLCARALTLSA